MNPTAKFDHAIRELRQGKLVEGYEKVHHLLLEEIEEAWADLRARLQAAEQEIAELRRGIRNGFLDRAEAAEAKLQAAEHERDAAAGKLDAAEQHLKIKDAALQHVGQQLADVNAELARLRAGGYLQHLPTCRSHWCSRCMLPIANADHRSPWGSPYQHVAEPEGCTCQLDPQSRAE